jgi:hypothetical protein
MGKMSPLGLDFELIFLLILCRFRGEVIGNLRGSRLEIDWVNFDEKRDDDEWHVKFIDNTDMQLIHLFIGDMT